MTLVAGIVCADGLVLCSDTELTGNTQKGNRAKIFTIGHCHEDCLIAIGVAGDYDFGKAAIQYMGPVFGEPEAPSLENMRSALSDAVTDVYTNHIYPNKLNQRDIYLMAAMWRQGEGVSLIKTSETALIHVERYEAIGTGGELAEYILKRMYADDMRLDQAVALAIHVLREVKERGQGVGGETHISVISNDGRLFEVLPEQVAEYEASMCGLDTIWQQTFYHCFDLTRSDAQYKKGCEVIGRYLKRLRGPMVKAEVKRRNGSPTIPFDQDEVVRAEDAPIEEADRPIPQRSKRGRKRQPPSPE
ncbi:MAG TPA: hypothetical protein VGD94_19070 [Vicinamibacterales bacterium]